MYRFALARSILECRMQCPTLGAVLPMHGGNRHCLVLATLLLGTLGADDDAAQPSEPTPAANPTELASVLDELREIDPELYQRQKQDLLVL